jgi:hypothetical protein
MGSIYVVALYGIWTSCCTGAMQWEIPQKYRQKPWVLSQHGCRISCSARLKLMDEVVVWWPEMHARGSFSEFWT